MSKKNTKKAIGDLYKRHLISIESDGIYQQKARKKELTDLRAFAIVYVSVDEWGAFASA